MIGLYVPQSYVTIYSIADILSLVYSYM